MITPMIHSGGGKILYWGSFRGDILELVEIPNCLNFAGYIQLFQDSRNVNVQFNYIPQQDNTPTHKAWFQQQHIIFGTHLRKN